MAHSTDAFFKQRDTAELRPESFLSGEVLVMLGWNTAVKNLKSLFGNRLLCQYRRVKGDGKVKFFILLYL